jgi:hypothetical protein
MLLKHGFVVREYVSLGEGPYKNVVKTVVTQARLGEPVLVLEQERGWYKVQMSDTYQGWVSPLDIVLVDEDYWRAYQDSPQVLVTAHFAYIYSERACTLEGNAAGQLVSAATMGTELKLVDEDDTVYQVEIPSGTTGYIQRCAGRIIPRFGKMPLGEARELVALAKEFLGLPYFWGGTTPYGFDCSGFVQTLLKMHGVFVLRDAYQQYEQGVAVERAALDIGDLVFWSTYRAGASHVGFYLGSGQYIHAGSSRGVAINSFNPGDENYSEELDKKYLGARRVLGGVRCEDSRR